MNRLTKQLIALLLLACTGAANAQTWFEQNDSELHSVIKQYDHSRYNTLINQYPISSDGTEQSIGSSTWKVEKQVSPIAGKPDGVEVEMRFICLSGSIKEAAVSVDWEIKRWSSEHYVLMPAVAYNGNRFESRRIAYSPKLNDYRDIGKEKPIIVSDILRLNIGKGFSRLQDRSGAFATPAIGFQAPQEKRGGLLLTDYGNTWGDYGLSIEETRERSRATLSITSPIVREQHLYMNCDSEVGSWDRGANFKSGDTVVIRFRLYDFEAPRVQTLFNTFALVRKSRNSGSIRSAQPYSYCQKIQEKKFNDFNFVSQFGYYSVGIRENFLQDWQIGWTGGMISTYPLLFFGNEQTRTNVVRNFDWLFPNGISPSGFYWDSGEKGTLWYGGDVRKPQAKNWHLVRKSGDAIYYIIKQFELMQRLGIPVKSSWEKGNQRVCDAFVRLWQQNGQLGNFVDSQTGEITVGGSCSGASAVGGLVLAARYYNSPIYLETAQAIGEYMYQNFTAKGFTVGGPGDAMQNPDSESSYALVESYALLFEATGQNKWLTYAEESAKQFATWVVTGDYCFPKNSLFGRCNIRTTGAVYANVQNKHGAPAICTASGVALLRLYRATGNSFYAELLRDIAHNITQYMPSAINPMDDIKPGWVCERVNITDWEGTDRIGQVLGLSTWAETGLMLTTIEIPGLYIRTDQASVTTFDNVEVRTVKSTSREFKIEVYNPTAVVAQITYLAENSTQAAQPLGENYLLNSKQMKLNPKETKVLTFKR